MVTKYGYNKELLESLKDGMSWTPAFTIAFGVLSIIPMLFLIIMVNHRDKPGLMIVYMIISGILDIVVSQFLKNKEVGTAAKIQLCRLAAAFGFSIILLIINDRDYENYTTVLIISAVLLLINYVFCMYSINSNTKKFAIINSNIIKCYLNIEKEHIAGMSFTNVEIADNGFYFELAYSDIRNVRNDSTGYCNLLIDYVGGTYKLSIENASYAVIAINDIKSAISKGIDPFAKKETNTGKNNEKAAPQKWKCTNCGKMTETNPCSECGEFSVNRIPQRVYKNSSGNIICPMCNAEQIPTRYQCYKCGQVFINGQPGIPYWCGNCGKPGPFDGNGECPDCGSSMKIRNI